MAYDLAKAIGYEHPVKTVSVLECCQMTKVTKCPPIDEMEPP